MPIRNLIVGLYKELEVIGHKHHELYDTDVRETLAETLLYYFVWGHPLEPEPCSYSMFSASADRKVSRAVTKFLRAATPVAAAEGIGRKARYKALQDPSILTPGGHRYDNFIGHSDTPPRVNCLQPFRFVQRE